MNWCRGTSFLRDQKLFLPKQLFPINIEPILRCSVSPSNTAGSEASSQKLGLLHPVQDPGKDPPGNLELNPCFWSCFLISPIESHANHSPFFLPRASSMPCFLIWSHFPKQSQGLWSNKRLLALHVFRPLKETVQIGRLNPARAHIWPTAFMGKNMVSCRMYLQNVSAALPWKGDFGLWLGIAQTKIADFLTRRRLHTSGCPST